MRLTYFSDNKGRNELIRLIFAVGKVQYDDEAIPSSEFRRRRDDNALPYGQLPTLSIGDEVFGQSCAIARYAAKVANIYPENELDALRADAIVDSWRDFLDLFYETVFSRRIIDGKLQMFPHPQSERYHKMQTFRNFEMQNQFLGYERLLSLSTSGGFCNSMEGPSWADLAVYDLVKTMQGALSKESFDALVHDLPRLMCLVERIDALDTIKDHLRLHPYKDISFLFEPPALAKKNMESVLFPFLRLVVLPLQAYIGRWKQMVSSFSLLQLAQRLLVSEPLWGESASTNQAKPVAA